MTHIMFDLETLDNVPSTVILSIGAVQFEPEAGMVDEQGGKLWFPNLDEQVEVGRTMSADTLMWWLKQDDAARREVTGARRQGNEKIKDELRGWLDWMDKPVYVWGNGSIFDIATLEHWMSYTKIPWKYYNVRDTRTLWHVHPYDKNAKGETAHTALEDAIAQSHRVCEVWPS